MSRCGVKWSYVVAMWEDLETHQMYIYLEIQNRIDATVNEVCDYLLFPILLI